MVDCLSALILVSTPYVGSVRLTKCSARGIASGIRLRARTRERYLLAGNSNSADRRRPPAGRRTVDPMSGRDRERRSPARHRLDDPSTCRDAGSPGAQHRRRKQAPRAAERLLSQSIPLSNSSSIPPAVRWRVERRHPADDLGADDRSVGNRGSSIVARGRRPRARGEVARPRRDGKFHIFRSPTGARDRGGINRRRAPEHPRTAATRSARGTPRRGSPVPYRDSGPRAGGPDPRVR